MKIENSTVTPPVEFQPVTIQITFESLAELHAVRTAIGMNNGIMIGQRIADIREEQTGTSVEYYGSVSKFYEALDNKYQVAIKRQSYN